MKLSKFIRLLGSKKAERRIQHHTTLLRTILFLLSTQKIHPHYILMIPRLKSCKLALRYVVAHNCSVNYANGAILTALIRSDLYRQIPFILACGYAIDAGELTLNKVRWSLGWLEHSREYIIRTVIASGVDVNSEACKTMVKQRLRQVGYAKKMMLEQIILAGFNISESGLPEECADYLLKWQDNPNCNL